MGKKATTLLYVITIALFLSVLGSSFYYFVYRESEIRKECNTKAFEATMKEEDNDKDLFTYTEFKDETYSFLYYSCLRSKGLNK